MMPTDVHADRIRRDHAGGPETPRARRTGARLGGAGPPGEGRRRPRRFFPRGSTSLGSLDDLSAVPDLCAECAGHGAVREYGDGRSGPRDRPDRDLDRRARRPGAVRAAARGGGRRAARSCCCPPARLPVPMPWRPPGSAGLDVVRYTSRKPPRAWKGTPAEEAFDLDAIDRGDRPLRGRGGRSGTALSAKRQRGRHDRARRHRLRRHERVRLVADPNAGGNIHQVHAEGMFGAFDIEVRGKPLPDNPKTSTLAAHSVVSTIRNRAAAVEIG